MERGGSQLRGEPRTPATTLERISWPRPSGIVDRCGVCASFGLPSAVDIVVPKELSKDKLGIYAKGKDALGEVFVHVQFNDKNYAGKAASVDVIDAAPVPT